MAAQQFSHLQAGSGIMAVMEEAAASDQFAPLYVESCHIRNFRGIVDCSLELEPNLTLLVGRNNAGKSRVLRALGVALGLPADIDDLTVESTEEATIDVVIAPPPPASDDKNETFSEPISRRLGFQIPLIQESPVRERFAWRTTIRKSGEGPGAVSESQFLQFDLQERQWILPDHAPPVTRDQRSLLAVELFEARRDLVEDFSKRSSAIRRVLNDLEVDQDTRTELQNNLTTLSKKILNESPALTAVEESLSKLEKHIDSIGKPSLNPLPPRLEELARSIAINLDTGKGAVHLRLHGAGVRNLASLQIQGVNYDRRLGRDGPSTRPHPLTLVEEPEAHLHPQAVLELCDLLMNLPGQIIASTHSSHLVTSIEPRCIRLLRQDANNTTLIDLGPAPSDSEARHRALRPDTHVEEMEKLKRLVERPFGELLFASAVVMGDGATERAFLPPVIRHALGHRAQGVCVIDPGSLGSDLAHAAVKFAKLAKIPWLLFCDSDIQGQTDAKKLVDDHADGDQSHIVWIEGENSNTKSYGAIENMMICFDEELCRRACMSVRPSLDTKKSTKALLKSLKGSVGAALARLLIEEYLDQETWPSSLQALISRLESLLRSHRNDFAT